MSVSHSAPIRTPFRYECADRCSVPIKYWKIVFVVKAFLRFSCPAFNVFIPAKGTVCEILRRIQWRWKMTRIKIVLNLNILCLSYQQWPQQVTQSAHVDRCLTSLGHLPSKRGDNSMITRTMSNKNNKGTSEGTVTSQHKHTFSQNSTTAVQTSTCTLLSSAPGHRCSTQSNSLH